MSHRLGSPWSIATVGLLAMAVCVGTIRPLSADQDAGAASVAELLKLVGTNRGICVVVDSDADTLATIMANRSELIFYIQLPSEEAVAECRRRADDAGLLGTRIFVEQGPWSHIQLADNLADAVIVPKARLNGAVTRDELLRVARPMGKVIVGNRPIVKPYPRGADSWSHHFHGPDNNPQSNDQLARAPYLTQFLGEPWYVPMPGVTVSAAGRVFTAHGHIAFHRRAWPWLHSLVAINGYNGTILWKRKLETGFMIHRNTIIATEKTLFLGDNRSCKLIDAVTGKVQSEIVEPAGPNHPCWKWMALEDGILYALLGESEPHDAVVQTTRPQGGWPWRPMSPGYDAAEYRWGFGRTFVAIDPSDGKVLWKHTEQKPIDTRAVAMTQGRIYYYSHPEMLACLDARQGKPVWRNGDRELIDAIGPHFKAQTWLWGFSSTAYMKCSPEAIYFAGPTRTRLVAASTEDGFLLWQRPQGNYQLVLRKEGLFALGSNEASLLLDPLTGKELGELNCRRAACTRATGSVDSIFTRGEAPPTGVGRHAGSMRLAMADRQWQRIALMRPPCQDGVMIANGLLYWGPWMCDCSLSLVGQLCLGPAGDFKFNAPADEADRLQTLVDPDKTLAPLTVKPGDWPTYRADNQRRAVSAAPIPEKVSVAWQFRPPSLGYPAAPVTAGGLVFLSGDDGIVRALDAADGKCRWKGYTGGRIYYPPAIEQGRLLVGSGDGSVHALEAATGRPLWRFRVAPQPRKIAEHGRLISTWPVGSGVLAADGVVYAAAGLASWDGTHVIALDAATGKIRWQNNTSGHLAGSDKVSGVSVQGHLLLHEGRLHLAGGNVVSPAIYDTTDGRCLNELPDEWAFGPRGSELTLLGNGVGVFGSLLYAPHEPGLGPFRLPDLFHVARGDLVIQSRGGPVMRLEPSTALARKPKSLWTSPHLVSTRALALGDGAVVAAGQRAAKDPEAEPVWAVAAFSVDDGRLLWSHELPAVPRTWGVALDAAGRVVVAMQDGQTLCLAAADE